jgi:hypothetical protein
VGVVVREGDSHDPGPVIIRSALEWGEPLGAPDMLTVHQRHCDYTDCPRNGCVTIYLEDA